MLRNKTVRPSCFLLFLLVLLGASVAQAMPPQNVELTFEVQFGSMRLGVGEDRLKHDGKRYQVYSDTIP